jgi:hypothetical protein
MVRGDGSGRIGRYGLPLSAARRDAPVAAVLEFGVRSDVVASGPVDVWRGSNL